MFQRGLLVPGCLALALAGCTIPGVPMVIDRSQEAVTVSGQNCTYRSQTSETATTNGMTRTVDSSITCGGRTYDCFGTPVDTCAPAMAAGRDLRPPELQPGEMWLG